MLDAFIIEEIRRRERDQRDDRPRLDLPLDEPTPHRQNDRQSEEKPQRGVVIIDYTVPPLDEQIPA